MTKLNSKFGFTLIELLVSITILAIVFGVVISSGSALQRNARDAQRKSDLATIAGALQIYFADNQKYPASMTLSTSNPFTSSTGFGVGTPPSPPKTYLKQTPIDPTNGSSYIYTGYTNSGLSATCDNQTNVCNYYLLCAKLENTSSSANCSAPHNYQVTPN